MFFWIKKQIGARERIKRLETENDILASMVDFLFKEKKKQIETSNGNGLDGLNIDMVVNCLESANGAWLRRSDISQRTGLSNTQVSTALNSLKRKNIVVHNRDKKAHKINNQR